MSDSYSSLWRKVLQDIVVSKSRPRLGFNTNEIEITQSILQDLPDDIRPDDIRRVLGRLSRGIVLILAFDEFDRVNDKRAIDWHTDSPYEQATMHRGAGDYRPDERRIMLRTIVYPN